MEVRRIRPGEGSKLREIRLKARQDAPDAYSTTIADVLAVPFKDWEEMARRRARGELDVLFVAVEGQNWFGMAGGVISDGEPGLAELVSLWVAPERRRSGIGLSLSEAVVGWARERGARQIALWVTRTNEPARTPYRHMGFVDTDRIQPLQSNPSLEEIMMSLGL